MKLPLSIWVYITSNNTGREEINSNKKSGTCHTFLNGKEFALAVVIKLSMQVDKSTKSSYLDYDKTELELFFNSLGSNAITFTVPVFQSSYFSYLDLSKTQLQDSALNFISLLPGIKHLKMSQCSLITNSGISFLASMILKLNI